MSAQIIYDSINFEDVYQKAALNYSTKVFKMCDGKKMYPDEETSFMYSKYSGFAPKKFNPVEKRDWIRLNIYPDQPSCLKLETIIESYDTALIEQKTQLLGKFDKLYTLSKSIKVPKEKDELELAAMNPDKPAEPKYKYCKFKLDMGWSYYYQEQKLDVANTKIIKKVINDARNNNKTGDKSFIENLKFTLVFVRDGVEVKEVVSKSEIKDHKEIITKIFYRNPESVPSDAKPVNECTEEELVKYYGEAKQVVVKSPEDLDMYYNFDTWTRYIFAPIKAWAAKTKDEQGLRRYSNQFQTNQIDIIKLPNNNGSQSSHKSAYASYSFGSKLSNNSVSNSIATVAANIVAAPIVTTPKIESLQIDNDDSSVDDSVTDEVETESDDDDDVPVVVKPKVVVDAKKTTGKKTPSKPN